MKNITQEFKKYSEELKSQIKPTETKSNQFRKNVINDFKNIYIEGHYKLLKQHDDFLGKSVYRKLKGFNYSLVMVNEELNRTELIPVLFNSTLNNFFKADLISFVVEKLTDELLNESLVYRSTNSFENLVFEWKIEAKQKLIKFYKKQLKYLTND